MKRSVPLRRTPLRPSLKRIERRVPLPKSTKRIRSRKLDPAKRRFAKHRDDAYTDWIKTLGCIICGRPGVDPLHIRPRSLGSDDRNNVVPGCRWHHDQQEGKTAEFERKYGVNLRELARWYTEQYDGAFA